MNAGQTLARKRSRGWCERCRANRATDFHHRLQRSLGGKDTAANYLHLCRRCHDRVHEQRPKDRVYETGWLIRGWLNPEDVPLLKGHHVIVRHKDDGSVVRLLA